MRETTDTVECVRFAAHAELARSRGLLLVFLGCQLIEPPPSDIQGVERLRAAWREVDGVIDDDLGAQVEEALDTRLPVLEALHLAHDAQLRIPGPRHLFPTESAHLGGTENDRGQWTPGRARGLAWQRVVDTYKRAGWSFDTSQGVEADHIGAELLFVGRLCTVEAEHWSHGDHQLAVSSLSQQKDFIEAHPLAWIDQLIRRILTTAASGYYPVVVKIAAGVLRLELSYTQRLDNLFRPQK